MQSPQDGLQDAAARYHLSSNIDVLDPTDR